MVIMQQKVKDKSSRCARINTWMACWPFILLLNVTHASTAIDSEIGINTLKSRINGKVYMARSLDTHYLKHLRTDSQFPTILDSTQGGVEERATNFLLENKKLFVENQSPLNLTTIRKSEIGRLNSGFAHFQQTYRDIPVSGAEIIVNLNREGVTNVHANLVPEFYGIPATAIITSDQAFNLAGHSTGLNLDVTAFDTSTPLLVIFNKNLVLGSGDRTSYLAWFIEISNSRLRKFVWIDSNDGSVLHSLDQIRRVKQRVIRNANNAITTNFGEIARNEPDPVTGITDVDMAFKHLGDVYDYFSVQHDRLSYDNFDSTMTASVLYCESGRECPTQDSFWKGGSVQTMAFGEGYAEADDIVAHEFTHGVLESTVGTPINRQAFAITESYADIFGEIVDQVNGSGKDEPSFRWLIGEDIPTGPLRNMLLPNESDQPARTSDSLFYCGSDEDVFAHTNNGVLNHAFALLVDGGEYNGFTINAVGLEKAAKIYYRTMDRHLLSSSGFTDAFEATQAACQQLRGEVDSGIAISDCVESHKALTAVELNLIPCSNQIPYCPSRQQANTMFQDDFESPISGKWSNSVLSGFNHWTGTNGSGPGKFHHTEPPNSPESRNYPLSGLYSLWANTSVRSSAGDSSVEMSKDITVPENARLQFEHNYLFDYDPNSTGGIIEYSTNGGQVWADASKFINAGNNYNGLLNASRQASFPASLSEKPGYVWNILGLHRDPSNPPPSELFEYISTQLDLSPLAGRDVRFRFRVGTHNFSAAEDRGWIIDDVRIYSCEPSSLVVSPNSGLQTTESGGTTTFNVALAFVPNGTLLLNLTSSIQTEGIITSPAEKQLTFNRADWDEPQSIVVTGQPDNKKDGNQIYSIVISDSDDINPAFDNISVNIVNIDADKKEGGIFSCSLNTTGKFDYLFTLLLLMSAVYFGRHKSLRSARLTR